MFRTFPLFIIMRFFTVRTAMLYRYTCLLTASSQAVSISLYF